MANMEPMTWHVIGDEITQHTTLAKSGSGLVDVYEVPYMIDSGPSAGHRGMVSIPVDRMSKEAVQAAVMAAASAVHDVGGLSG